MDTEEYTPSEAPGEPGDAVMLEEDEARGPGEDVAEDVVAGGVACCSSGPRRV